MRSPLETCNLTAPVVPVIDNSCHDCTIPQIGPDGARNQVLFNGPMVKPLQMSPRFHRVDHLPPFSQRPTRHHRQLLQTKV